MPGIQLTLMLQHPSRRQFLRSAALAGAGSLIAGRVFAQETVTLPFAHGERQVVAFPQKRPLIVLTTRPPQLETPFAVFNDGLITPNDAFFVRYHNANVPTSIDGDAFRIEVKGAVKTPLSLSVADLKKQFEPVEVVAVNQCSGNSRGFSQPRVGGGQLGHGAMGNARWRGVRLKDVLEKAGIQAGAKQVVCNGLDNAVTPQTPDFIKALDLDHALDGEMLLAFEMNGAELPMLNGYPLRLVVPGYFGTYWVKHINELTVVGETFDGFYMNPAYRVPDNASGCIEPGTKPASTVPISRFKIRSFITSLAEAAPLAPGKPVAVRGIAFDSGQGITEVHFSDDGGKTWQPAELGKELGKYSFREWTIAWTPKQAGAVELKSRAFNRIGETQPLEALWNPSGYLRNVVESVKVTIS